MMEQERRSSAEAEPRGFGITSLLRELRADATSLVRKEIALVRAEMSEKVTGVSRNSVYMGLGGVILYTGSCFILLGLSMLLYFGLLRAGFSPIAAACTSFMGMGLVLGLVGAGLVVKGRRNLKNEGMKLDKTMQSLEENKVWAKRKVV